MADKAIDIDKAVDVGKDAKVRDWFRRIRASDSAKASFTKGLQYFVDFVKLKGISIGETPSEILDYAKTNMKKDVFEWKDEIEGIIAEFEEWLTEKPKIVRGDYSNGAKLAPKTIQTYISAVRSFFNAFNIDVPRRKRKQKTKPLEENNRRLTKEIVREALKYADVRAKAITLCMLSGGLGDSELLNLKIGTFIRGRGYEPVMISDLDGWINEEKRKCEEEINKDNLDHGITMLFIRRPKTAVDYLTFLTPEATLAILDYLAWRNRPTGYSQRHKGIGKIREEKRKVRSVEDYLFIKTYIDNWYLPPEVIEELKPARIEEPNCKYKSRATCEMVDETIKKRKALNLTGYAEVVRKLDREGLMAIFRDLAKKAGVSTNIGTYQLLRGHNLRKLFYTLLRAEGVDSFELEFWMGHTIPEEQEAYFQAIPEKLKKIYARYMHVLLVGEFETKVIVSEEYKELKAENEALKREMENLKRMGERSSEFMDDFMKIIAEDPELMHRFKEFGGSSKN